MSSHSYQDPANHPPASYRPQNISERPSSDGTIYVETAMPPPQQQQQFSAQQQQQVNMNEVAGVLRRNQACLACRRRKLKCDAQRPHCGTCVRSHKHMLKTSPQSNPVLTCEYDDGAGGSGMGNDEMGGMSFDQHSASPHSYTVEDDAGNDSQQAAGAAGKKKRKTNNGEGRRKRKGEEEGMTEELMKRIEDLEAQLAQSRVGPAPASAQTQQKTWPSAQAFQQVHAASSPTAFLEMLSSAASAQAPDSSASANASIPGLRSGASESAMMNDNQSTGLTPFFQGDYAHPPPATPAPAYQPAPSAQRSQSDDQSSRRSSTGQGPSPFGMTSSSTAVDSGSSSVLSPNGIFNFSPGPSGPTSSNPPPPQQPASLNNMGQFWPPPPPPNGVLEPSTKVDGPWRAIETVDTVFQATLNEVGIGGESHISIDVEGDGVPMDEALQQKLLMDLFWPGWPPNLPEPNVVNDLAEAFFDLVPNIPRVLHRARFFARLALPPTHANFPHPSLIHAVCASAAAWCPPSVYERSATWKNGVSFLPAGTSGNEQEKEGGKMNFGLKQAFYAKEAVQDGLNTGNRLFDVVRAMIVLCRVFIDDTRMLECWAYSGLVARMLLPLGLNVRSAELSLKSVMLPPPADALEREERRAAVWMAFYHDTVASAASGWGTSMSIDELSVPLPVSAKEFDSGRTDIEANPQDLDSPDFWTKHPVQDPFVMCLKASVIMNRVNRFVRRWKNRHLREDDDLDGLNRPEFRELANAIACLQMSFPASMRNPCRLNAKRQLDIDLISAHMMPHAATICLYEPFADIADANDGPARRILGAAQAIVSIVQQLASVVNDGVQNFTSIMHSSASVCLVTAARTSLLFYRYCLNVNDYNAAEGHRMDIEMIRMALGQFGLRFKIGHHHSQLIEYFLDRATNPTYDKLAAHYPEHPRPGAPDLTPNSHFGQCVLNALNIKRGYWRTATSFNAAGLSPYGATAESIGQPSARRRDIIGASNSFTGSVWAGAGASIESESPNSPHDVRNSSSRDDRPGSSSGTTGSKGNTPNTTEPRNPAKQASISSDTGNSFSPSSGRMPSAASSGIANSSRARHPHSLDAQQPPIEIPRHDMMGIHATSARKPADPSPAQQPALTNDGFVDLLHVWHDPKPKTTSAAETNIGEQRQSAARPTHGVNAYGEPLRPELQQQGAGGGPTSHEPSGSSSSAAGTSQERVMGVTGTLTKDMEELFNSVHTVKNGQKLGMSGMQPGGAFSGGRE